MEPKEVIGPVTFNEFWSTVSKEFQTSKIRPFAKHRTQSIQLPLEFISSGSTMFTAPLLYKLKHGSCDQLVSDLIFPQILSIYIDASVQTAVKKESTIAEENSPLSSFENGYLKTVIKAEPLDDSEESGSNEVPSTSGSMQDNPAMPVITKAYSCEDTNSSSGHNLRPRREEESIAKKVFLPLVFTLKGSINNSSYNTRPLVYILKQGPDGSYATEESASQIYSLTITSLDEATFRFKSTSMFKTEGPLKVNIRVEYSRNKVENSNGAHPNKRLKESPSMSGLNASSCSSNPEATTTCDKPRSNQLSSKVNGATSTAKPSEKSKAEPEKNIDHMNDEDYKFLMSLLPELKQLPPHERNNVKAKIKDLVFTSRLISSKIQVEKRSTNIYRDCGVLPTMGGWKF